ncbi:MAG: hypothetical protein ACR2HV_10230, partial [Acidimicrobiales bacterium]
PPPDPSRAAAPPADPPTPPSAPGDSPPPATARAVTTASPTDTATTGSDTAGPDTADTAFPSRDALTMAWGDHVLGSLSRRASVRFQGGRFVSAEGGVAEFALPNAVHRDRCEEVRAEAEAALSAHFGRPVPVRLTVDGTPPPTTGAEAVPPPDHDVDVDDLRDAPAGGLASPLDHVMQAFEGAQVVEE